MRFCDGSGQICGPTPEISFLGYDAYDHTWVAVYLNNGTDADTERLYHMTPTIPGSVPGSWFPGTDNQNADVLI